MAAENKRKKLRYMKKAELIDYANSCPGIEVTGKMTVRQIMQVIPEEFRDLQSKDVTAQKQVKKKTANVIHEYPEGACALGTVGAKRSESAAGSSKLIPIKEAVRIKANTKLRKYISMEGKYRYGLTEEQIKLADEQIKRAGCTRPVSED
jgi:hypothetical protein